MSEPHTPPTLRPVPPAPPTPSPERPRYQQIAQALAQLIDGGSLKAGQRLPSVRETSLTHGVSLSTAMQAYRQLEEQGLVQARPKAGYFVRRPLRIAQPGLSAPPQRSFLVERQTRSEGFAMLHQPGDRASFGGFSPQSSTLFDEERLRVALGRASRVHRHSLTEYNKADVQGFNSIGAAGMSVGMAWASEAAPPMEVQEILALYRRRRIEAAVNGQ